MPAALRRTLRPAVRSHSQQVKGAASKPGPAPQRMPALQQEPSPATDAGSATIGFHSGITRAAPGSHPAPPAAAPSEHCERQAPAAGGAGVQPASKPQLQRPVERSGVLHACLGVLDQQRAHVVLPPLTSGRPTMPVVVLAPRTASSRAGAAAPACTATAGAPCGSGRARGATKVSRQRARCATPQANPPRPPPPPLLLGAASTQAAGWRTA